MKAKREIEHAAKAFNADMEKAAARVGSTAESKLRWLLQFKEKDLNSLTRGERIPLGNGLRCLPGSRPTHGGKVARSVSFMMEGFEMPDEMIFELQNWTMNFFAALASPQGDYEYEPPEKMLIHRMSPLKSKRIIFQQMPLFNSRGERPAVKDAIINIVLAASDKLRFCLQCKAPFVAHRRQAYCTPKCSQTARDIRRGRSYSR
jgi:hypothetical protein